MLTHENQPSIPETSFQSLGHERLTVYLSEVAIWKCVIRILSFSPMPVLSSPGEG